MTERDTSGTWYDMSPVVPTVRAEQNVEDNTTTLTFHFGGNPPPADVLIEHLAYAIASDFKETKLTDIKVRNHPFEGPEVFDDYPQLEAFDKPQVAPMTTGTELPASPWPNIDRAIRAVRKKFRSE